MLIFKNYINFYSKYYVLHQCFVKLFKATKICDENRFLTVLYLEAV